MNIATLRLAHDYRSLAPLFGMAPGTLKAVLYSGSGHKTFSIAKKSGGIRVIASPSPTRKALQRKLLPVLEAFYKPSAAAHGFLRHRSVVTNARGHVQARTVINIDIEDFFPTISFQRVRGIFLSRHMGLTWPVANILAQVCCYQGALSTGGITSPIVSNICCAGLDKRLLALAKRLGGKYSRYADDLTMSFDRPVSQLSSIVLVDDLGSVSIGAALSEILADEGFKPNLGKLRTSTNAARKVVTGLVVNERINVRRGWLRELESKIYAMEKFGVADVSAADFPEISDADVASRVLLRRIHGKISYLSMVRGRGDWVAARLADRFNKLHSNDQLRVPAVELVSRVERLSRAVFIVNCASSPLLIFDSGESQGTAFATPSGLLVTAAHVVAGGGAAPLSHVYVMNERKRSLVECDVRGFDLSADIAILSPRSSKLEMERYRLVIDEDAGNRAELNTVGFPNYLLGDLATRVRCDLVRTLVDGGVRKADIGGAVQGGLSGAPVLDVDLRVTGLVHKGVGATGGVAQMVQVSEAIRVAVSCGLRL